MLFLRCRLLSNRLQSTRCIFPASVENLKLTSVVENCPTSYSAAALIVSDGSSRGYHSLSCAQVKLISQTPFKTFCRNQVRKADQSQRKDIVTSEDKPFSELSTAQKVKQVGTDATYSVIVVAGIIVTGGLFFAIGRELFSGQSPSGIYGKALKLIRKHDDIVVALGEPIKGYGETNRRGRRRHVDHMEYEKDGVKHMRMKFYVEGPDKKGTAHLEAQQVDGKYIFRYLFVSVEDYPPRTIIIEDNRSSLAVQ